MFYQIQNAITAHAKLARAALFYMQTHLKNELAK